MATQKPRIQVRDFSAAAMDTARAARRRDAPRAICEVVLAAVSAAYAGGLRREHLFPGSLKGRQSHPLFEDLRNGRMKVDLAYQATMTEFGHRIMAKDRELTQQAHNALLDEMEQFFMEQCAPKEKAPSAEPKESDLDKALRLVHKAASEGGMSDVQAGILRSAFETLVAKLPEMPAPQVPAPRAKKGATQSA